MDMLYYHRSEFSFSLLSFIAISLIFKLISKFLNNLFRHLNYDFTQKSSSKKLLCTDNVNTSYSQFFQLIMKNFVYINLIAKTENSGFQDAVESCLL